MDFDLKDTCFEENEQIHLTEYTQPCLVTACLAMAAELRKRGFRPDMTAGLSLGEYAAIAAAGGIADGRGVAAALMLGAEGVQMGTRFVATTECQVHPNYKEKVLKARDIDTRVTGRTTGHPVRALRNEMTKKYLEMEAAGATAEELEYLTLGGLRKAVVEGDVKNGSVMSGQIAGLVKDELPCKEVVENVMAETEKVLKGAAKYE